MPTGAGLVADSEPRPDAAAGWFGKLPSRADFVRAGLTRSMTEMWDQHVSAALAGSRTVLGEAWIGAWNEAPVWRFALPEGACGPEPVLGLWMPSADKVGRSFPLMIAATCPGGSPEHMARHGAVWLDAAERAGRAAIADDLNPEQLKARIPPAPDLAAAPDTGLPYDMQPRPRAGLWWTEGSPRVPAQGLVLDAMPDAATFVAMLEAGHRAP